MSKHTSGPWTWEYSNDTGPNDDYFIEFFEIRSQDGIKIAEVAEQKDARLIAAAPELLEALRDYQAAQKMPRYGDYEDFGWPTSKMRQEGQPAWGWICEKHGLGYQSGCICCRGDFERHQERKDRDARYARDDALRIAEEKSRAAIAKAEGLNKATGETNHA